MKNAVLFLIVIAGLFLGCSDKEQVITLNDFDRLITADSIRSLYVYNDDKAVITKRSSLADDEKLVLLISSAQDFRDKLDTRYPNNKISSVSFIRNGHIDMLFYNLIPILLMICMLVYFLIAAIDILKNRFVSDIEKLIWILVVIFVPLIGPTLYLVIGRKQKLNFEK